MVDEKDERNDFVPRRILVALESSAVSVSALESAVNLAAALEAELEGLFVEDVDLLRLSELPSSHEVHWSSAVLEPMNVLAVQRAFRVQAQRMRRILDRSAKQARVTYSFQIVQGRISQIAQSATQADMMVMGRARRLEPGRPAPGLRSAPPVMVFLDQTESSAHALAAAVRICQASGPPLLVYVWADDPEQGDRLREEAVRQLQAAKIRATVRPLRECSAKQLHQLVKRARAIPILGVDQRFLSRQDFAQFIDLVDFLLLVR